MQRNYDFQIKGSEAMLWLGMDKLNSLRVQSTTIGLVENQFQLKEWQLSRKVIYKDQWCLRVFANILSQQTQNDNDKECQLDFYTYGINHNESKQVLQSNKLLRISGGSNSISMTIVKHMNNWGMSGYSISVRINRRGIQVTRNSKAVSSRDYRNHDEFFRVSCNNKTNWGWYKNNNCK